MLVKAGLDFGTTTSTLSYMEDGRLKAFWYGGEEGGGTPYVPTAIKYFDDDLQIGQFAVDYSSDVPLHRFFKMALPLEPANSDSPSPQELTADFIGELIKGTSTGRKRFAEPSTNSLGFQDFAEHEIESLVVSVPHIWEKEAARGRQRLEQVVQDVLELNSIKLISEPVAAAAYFSYSYQQRNRTDYQGNLLVCDMGGGTFDVTLCRLKPNRIEVLQNDGSRVDGFGRAGMYFNRSLINSCFGDDISEQETLRLVHDLDKQKHYPLTERFLNRSLSLRSNNFPIYTLSHGARKETIKLNLIEEAFKPIREEILAVLTRLQAAADESKEKINKVILVGGFSRFPLVQQTIRDFFDQGEPPRVDLQSFPPKDIAFAISYGACLVANNVVTVSERFQHTIGIIVTDASGQDIPIDLVRAGKDLDQLRSSQFGQLAPGEALTFALPESGLDIDVFIRKSGSLSPADTIVRNLVVEVANFSPTNRWTLGARIDYSKEPFLTIRDHESGEEREHSIGKLFPEVVERLDSE